MSAQNLGISDEAKDGLSVAPPDPKKDGDTPAAGSTGDMSQDEKVDIGSEDSMDASDPPSTSIPSCERDEDRG